MADGSLLFDTKLNTDGVKKGIAGLGSVATKAMTGVVAAVSTTTVATAALVKSAVGNYAEYEQLVGGVETLFKDSSDTVMGYADNAYKTAGMSANQYMNTVTSFSASLLQGLGGDTKQAVEVANLAITDMSDNANKMGSDMESIQNAYQGFAKQNYTMLDNLKLGYGGTQSEMIRLMNDSGILEEKIDSLDNITFDQMIQAIHEVQTNMDITGTTAKEASTTIEGSVNSAKSAWSNLVTGIADDNQDFDQLVDNFIESASVAGDNILPRVEIAINGVGRLIDELLPVIIESVPNVISGALPGMLDAGVNIAEVIGQGIASALPQVVQFLPQLTELAIEITSQLGQALVDNAPQILESVQEIIDTVLSSFGELCPAISPFTGALQMLVDNFDAVLAVVIPLAAAFASYKTIMLITEGVTKAVTAAQTALSAVLNMSPIGIIVMLISALVAAFIYLWNTSDDFRQFWIDLWDNICSFFSDTWEAIVDFFTETIPNLINNIGTWFSELPGKIWEWLVNTAVKIVEWQAEIKQKAKDAITGFIDKAVDTITSLPGKIKEWLFNAALKVVEWQLELQQKAKDAIIGLKDKVVDTIKDLPEKIKEAGINVALGFYNGIKEKIEWVKEQVGNFFSGIIDCVEEVFDIHSPSRKFGWIAEMCVEGFDRKFDEYNPYDTLSASMKANAGTLKMNYLAGMGNFSQSSSKIDYNKMGEATASAFERAGLKIVIGNKEAGRIMRSFV